MASKGSSGSRRWIARQPIDTRPIIGMDDDISPAWLLQLEAFAPYGCAFFSLVAIIAGVYAFTADCLAGHL